MKTFILDTLLTLLIATVIFFGLQATVQSFIVEGPSMTPNFHDGQRILVNKIIYKIHEPQRGDVVIFIAPNSHKDDYIKRIIGLPGESVDIKDGVVYIHKADGTVSALDEKDYITEQANYDFSGGKISENEYFVMGDNRNNSDDSRHGWTMPHENIIGKVWLSIWPPDEWGLVANYALGSN